MGLGLEGLRRRRFGALGLSECCVPLFSLELVLPDSVALHHECARADGKVSVLASPGSGGWGTTSVGVGIPTRCWIQWTNLTWCAGTMLRAPLLRRTRLSWA